MNSFLEKIIDTDINLFLFLNGFHNDFFDTIMYYVSGKYTWIPLYVAIIVFIVRKYKFKKSILAILTLIFLVFISDGTSVFLFKFIFLRLRPCFNPDISSFVHTVTVPGGRFGFISSHATNSFAFATFTTLLFKNKKYSLLIFFWAFLVSYSRIYLGVHYPGDVFFGAVWGCFIAVLLYDVTKKNFT